MEINIKYLTTRKEKKVVEYAHFKDAAYTEDNQILIVKGKKNGSHYNCECIYPRSLVLMIEEV